MTATGSEPRASVGPSLTMVLAFDASCATCRAVSERVQAATAGKLATRGLGDPDVVAWREQSMQSPPWEPTLLRVTEKPDQTQTVRAWMGRNMIAPLVKHLGLGDAVRVVRALGALRQEWSDIESQRTKPRTVTRRSVFQIGLGTAVSAGILSYGASNALAAPSANPDFRRTRTVVGSELTSSLPEVFDHPDVGNLVSEAQLQGLRNAAVRPSEQAAGTELRSSSEGQTKLAADDIRPGQVSLAHQARHQTQAGGDVRVTAVSLPGDRILVLEEYAPSFQSMKSKAFLADMDYAAGTATFTDYSVNGRRDEPVGAQARAECQGYPKDDPCGGCCLNGSGSVLVERCKTSNVYKCAFGAASCAACGASCGGGSFGAACGLCLFGACGNAVIACCDRTGPSCSSNACL